MKWMILFILTQGLFIAAQEVKPAPKPVSGQYDSEMNKLIQKVEGSKPQKSNFINDFKPETEKQTEVVKRVESYWHAMMDERYDLTYAMHEQRYRDKVKIAKYMSKDRLALTKVHIRKIQFEGDCAKASGYLWGNQASAGNLRVPFITRLLKKDDGWYVFDNPYQNAMVRLPQARHFKFPCEFKDNPGKDTKG